MAYRLKDPNVLNIRSVAELVDVNYETIKTLCKNNVIGLRSFQKNPSGKSKNRRFDVVDCVAIMYAVRWWKLGFSNVVISTIYDFLSEFTEDQLLGEFRKGNRCLLPVPGSTMKLRPKRDDTDDVLNLFPIYQFVKAYMGQHTGAAASTTSTTATIASGPIATRPPAKQKAVAKLR